MLELLLAVMMMLENTDENMLAIAQDLMCVKQVCRT